MSSPRAWPWTCLFVLLLAGCGVRVTLGAIPTDDGGADASLEASDIDADVSDADAFVDDATFDADDSDASAPDFDAGIDANDAAITDSGLDGG